MEPIVNIVIDWALAGFIVGSITVGFCGSVVVILLFFNTIFGIIKGG